MNDMERERQDYRVSRYSLKMAHYCLTDDVSKRCNVCDDGEIVLFDGCRLCEQHRAFVTCGATCNLHKKKEK